MGHFGDVLPGQFLGLVLKESLTQNAIAKTNAAKKQCDHCQTSITVDSDAQ